MVTDPAPAVPRERAADDPPFDSVGDLVVIAARRYDERDFLRDSRGSVTFIEAEEITRRVAGQLRSRGVGAGDRVAIMLPNGREWPLTWLAILRLGAVAVPVNHAYRRADLAHVLADSQTRLLVTGPEGREAVAAIRAECPDLEEVLPSEELHTAGGGPAGKTELPEVTVTDLANLQYTSGTTGFPKACMLDHDYWLRMGWLTATLSGATADDVILTSQPFSYMDPQWNTMLALTAGIPLVVLERFSASGFWPEVRRHGVTFFYVLGTMPVLLSKQPPDPADRDNKVRMVMCSGIVPELHAQFEERWGAPWREAYGLTETGVDLAVGLEEEELVGSGLIGRPVPTKEAAVVDEQGRPVPDGEIGEVVIRGRPMMQGYWRNEEATAAVMREGWFHTGDLGSRDSAGRFRLVGRLKDMVRRGGENISAAEVEHVLSQHEAVLSVAVVPAPDDLWGEEVKAFVRLRADHQPSAQTAADVSAFAGQRLARFKVPRYVHFVDEFPMTPSERVAKPVLIERWAGRSDGLFDNDGSRNGAAPEERI